MNNIKVIDLLIMISRGEEVPKKIRFDNINWNKVYGEKYMYYKDDYDNDFFLYFFRKNLDFTLNDEIEIIEEDKKDEEIEVYINGKKVDVTDIYEPLKQGEYIYKENGKWYAHRLKNVTFEVEEDKKIEKLERFIPQRESDTYCTKYNEVADKINEIIDYINKEE